MEKALVEHFIDKSIWFTFADHNNKLVSLAGTLTNVTDESIVIDYKGHVQVFSLDTIRKMVEYLPKRTDTGDSQGD